MTTDELTNLTTKVCRMKRLSIAVLASTLVLAVGCSSSSNTAAPAVTVTPTTAAVGAVHKMADGATVQVDSAQTLMSDYAQEPGQFLAVEARTCVTASGSITTDAWTAHDPAGDTFKPELIPIGVPRTMQQYLNDPRQVYRPGDCDKGWIFFKVPTGSSKMTVRYAIGDGSAGYPFELFTWQT